MVDNLTSVWISANAGSGKTRALVDRVVQLLLRGVEPERIFCITYTKAAANEMRERIVKELRALLVASDVECDKKLLQIGMGSEKRTYARGLFARVLDSPSGGIQLTTIHGFCQQLLKKFPLEAGISPFFAVVDDAQRERLQRTARNRLFDVQHENPVSQSLRLLAERSGEMRMEVLLNSIEQNHGEWSRVLNQQSPEHVAELIYAAHGVSPEMTADGLHTQFVQTLLSATEVNQLRRTLPEFLGHKNATEQRLGAILVPWLESFPTRNSALTHALTKHFVTEKYTPNQKSISKNAPLPELLTRMRDECVAYRRQLAALVCAEESAALATVAFSYRALLQQLKFETQQLDYDDLIQKTIALLSGPMIGWVMRKLDHRIDHLLIDEAQDTSPDQWRIAQPLVEELIATNDGLSDGAIPRTLLVVGDEKQSIFSFQGAAPEYFAREEVYFQQLLCESNAPLTQVQLTTSYRSANAVLTLVDALARLPSVAPALSESGGVANHRLYRADAVGMVRLYPLVVGNKKTATEPFSIAKIYAQSQSAATMLADRIAQTIADWLKHQRYLQSEKRPIRPDDILILVHRRNPMAQALIHALEKHHVPVSGIDRLMLSKHLAVRDVMACMAWCMHPADDLALAQLLRSPIIGMSDEALRIIAVDRDGSLWDALKNAQSCDRLETAGYSAAMQENAIMQLEKITESRNLTPYEFITVVLEIGGARRRFAERFGAEVHEILDELKSQAAQMPAGMVPSIAYFYDWLASSDRVIKREHEAVANAVQIMTVHGAKGLEAPVVIMADTMTVPDLSKETVLFVNDMNQRRIPVIALSGEAELAPLRERARSERKAALDAEYQRLLYVALTRARDEVHVFGFANEEPKLSDHSQSAIVTSWYETVRAAFAQLPNVRSLADDVLEYADDGSEIAASVSSESAIEPKNMALPAFLMNEVPPLVRIREVPLSPSRIGVNVLYRYSGKGNASDRGVRMHRMLQWLRADCDHAMIATLVNMAAPDWESAEKQRTCSEIAAMLAAHAWVWGENSQAEVSVAGKLEINGRMQSFMGQIDRIIDTADGIVIVDFKTGHPTSVIAENYLLQLKVYQSLVKMTVPDRTVRCALLWTATAQLQWLDESVEQMAWPASLSFQELMGNQAGALDAYAADA